MKKVYDLYDLDEDVKSVLNDIVEHESNVYTTRSYRGWPSERISLYQYDSSITYWNDLNFVKKIDALNVSSPHKLLLYFFHNPVLIDFEDLLNIVQQLNLSRHAGSASPLFNSIRRDILRSRGFNDTVYGQNSEEIINVLYSFFTGMAPKLELAESLVRLNVFIEEAEDEESYEDFYQRRDDEYLIDGRLDLSQLEKYEHTEKIFQTFENSLVGTMGETVNKGVTKKLKTLPKKTYTKILEENKDLKGKTIRVLDDLLDDLSGPALKLRTVHDNHDLFLNVLLKKVLEDEGFETAKFLHAMTHEFSYYKYGYGVKNDIQEKNSTLLMDIILENQEYLTVSQMIALKSASENRRLWVRTGDEINTSILLFKYLEQDLQGMANMLEYLVFENKKQPPTITQWRNASEEDLFDLPPVFALDFINETDRLSSFLNAVSGLRRAYKDKVFQ